MMSRICKGLKKREYWQGRGAWDLIVLKFYEGRGEGMECMFKKRAIIMEKGGLNQTGNPSYGGEKVVFHLL